MIKDILDNRAKVNLFTRPHRFGKTLALSMLRYFFEKELEADGKQTEEQNYNASLYKEGYRRFLKYGICFYRKECLIKARS